MSYKDLDIVLIQCERQAEKLSMMELGDDFFAELEIFDSYFSQLRQVIENVGGIQAERVEKLRGHMAVFAAIMDRGKTDIMSKIGAVGSSRANNAYSAPKPAAVKFENWS